jgi:hypothetical protein
MKIQKTKAPKSETKATVIRSAAKITIHHHQSIRLSKNYNSAEASYGVTIDLPPNVEESLVESSVNYAEEFVQDRLVSKSREQYDALNLWGQA